MSTKVVEFRLSFGLDVARAQIRGLVGETNLVARQMSRDITSAMAGIRINPPDFAQFDAEIKKTDALVEELHREINALNKESIEIPVEVEGTSDAGLGGIEKEINGIERSAGRMGGTMRGAIGSWIGNMAANATQALAQFAVQGVGYVYQQAVNLPELESKFNTVFDGVQKEVTSFVNGYSSKMGLTKAANKDFLATTATILQGAGYTKQGSAEASVGVAKLAADLQSFHNIPIDQAFNAINSGLTGEREALKQFGIVVSEAEVQELAMIQTGKKSADALTQQEKATASLALIRKKAGVANGDLERTEGSLANQIRAAKADLLDMTQTLIMGAFGTKEFQDSAGGVVKVFREMLPGIKDFIGSMFDSETAVGGFLSKAWEAIKVVFGLGQQLLQTASEMFGFKNGGELLNALFGFMGEVLTKVSMALGWLTQGLKFIQPVLNVVGGIVKGVWLIFKGLSDTIWNVTSAIMNFIGLSGKAANVPKPRYQQPEAQKTSKTDKGALAASALVGREAMKNPTQATPSSVPKTSSQANNNNKERREAVLELAKLERDLKIQLIDDSFEKERRQIRDKFLEDEQNLATLAEKAGQYNRKTRTFSGDAKTVYADMVKVRDLEIGRIAIREELAKLEVTSQLKAIEQQKRLFGIEKERKEVTVLGQKVVIEQSRKIEQSYTSEFDKKRSLVEKQFEIESNIREIQEQSEINALALISDETERSTQRKLIINKAELADLEAKRQQEEALLQLKREQAEFALSIMQASRALDQEAAYNEELLKIDVIENAGLRRKKQTELDYENSKQTIQREFEDQKAALDLKAQYEIVGSEEYAALEKQRITSLRALEIQGIIDANELRRQQQEEMHQQIQGYVQSLVNVFAEAFKFKRQLSEQDISIERAELAQKERDLRASYQRRQIDKLEYDTQMMRLEKERGEFDKKVEADRATFLQRSAKGIKDLAISSIEEVLKKRITAYITENVFDLLSNKQKRAELLKTLGIKLGANAAETGSNLKTAGSNMISGVASTIKSVMSSIPFPFNVLAVGAAVGGIYALYKTFKDRLTGFYSGGYTGNVGKNNIAGVVHGNEVVMESAITNGQVPEWLALRKLTQQGVKVSDILAAAGFGFANGGYVAPYIPDLAVISPPNISVNPPQEMNMAGFVERLVGAIQGIEISPELSVRDRDMSRLNKRQSLYKSRKNRKR